MKNQNPSGRLVRPAALASLLTLIAVLAWLGCSDGDAADKTAQAAKAKAKAKKAFVFEDVVALAQQSAKGPFEDSRRTVPKWLLDVNYDQWRDIRFRTDRSLWADDEKQRFNVQFFHPGMFYDRAVAIHTVDAKGSVQPVPFSPSLFDYGKNDFASRVPQDLGFAGFRVHYPLNKPSYKDELIVFLGGSYFRALAKDLVFGISARGLAVDTALPSGEEFPFFKEFWILTPPPNAKEITVWALLDSPRVTGAYAFTVTPGEDTVVSVDSRVFLRKEIGKLGVGPLTSMYFHGENSLRRWNDFRPEVHDSDGLLLNFASGEWMWRPLDNPDRLQAAGFQMPNPKGFGLVQRDRNFDHYQDLETRYDERPSTWVEPKAGWGAGHVELVEIPTKDEVNDNVVAYWVPAQLAKPGEPMTFAYDLHWYREAPMRPPGGRVVATRRDSGTMEGVHRFIVDFEGEELAKLPADTIVRGVINVGARTEIGEELVEQHVVKNPITGGWRLGFQVRPKSGEPLELRAFLQKGDEALTETWSAALRP